MNEKIINAISDEVASICNYFDWEHDSEQAETIRVTLTDVAATAFTQGKEAGMKEEREKWAEEITIEKNKILSGSIGPLFDAGWNAAIQFIHDKLSHPTDEAGISTKQ